MSTPTTVSAGYTKRIERIIERLGGQTNLAKAAGVKQPTISGWLRGAVPYKSVLDRMCAEIGINPRWVLFGEEPEEMISDEPELAQPAIHSHVGRGAIVNEDVQPGAMDARQLCGELSALVGEWPDTPGAFQRMGWERIEALYTELNRRVKLDLDTRRAVRNATNIYPYPKSRAK
jgi:transcriptional regulator with XRE-family HTH domain